MKVRKDEANDVQEPVSKAVTTPTEQKKELVSGLLCLYKEVSPLPVDVNPASAAAWVRPHSHVTRRFLPLCRNNSQMIRPERS